jgi:hypothetical protein
MLYFGFRSESSWILINKDRTLFIVFSPSCTSLESRSPITGNPNFSKVYDMR